MLLLPHNDSMVCVRTVQGKENNRKELFSFFFFTLCEHTVPNDGTCTLEKEGFVMLYHDIP